MKTFISILLSPMAFAVGFLWPLTTQSLVALSLVEAGWTAISIGAVIALAFGTMAHLRGSWVWIK